MVTLYASFFLVRKSSLDIEDARWREQRNKAESRVTSVWRGGKSQNMWGLKRWVGEPGTRGSQRSSEQGRDRLSFVL